jgi:hypothetical protein
MAQYDKAALLASCKLEAKLPATSEFPTDANWYAWLTEAQEHWYGQFSIHCPWVIMEAPTLLTTTDSGVTYDFPDDADGDPVEPLAVSIFDRIDGRPLKNAAFWDVNGDYVWEGNKIRFPRNRAKTFSSGPYARFVNPPGLIDGSNEPTLKPKRARKLLVYRACAIWASRGGKRNPAPFFRMEAAFWIGNPAVGDFGLLGELKMQNPWQGTESVSENMGGILAGVDNGQWYQIP